MSALQAPFPWFGGKSRVAPEVWERFGDVKNYVEPFFGSGAVLLGRPEEHTRSVETVNDLDGFVSNFWRSVAADPVETARYADWPVIEADLNARHSYLITARESLLRKLEGDPEYYDPRIAGWWVGGVCSWIGSGYCSGKGPWFVRNGELVKLSRSERQLPHLGNAGTGVESWFALLSERLRRTRVANGDWKRVLGSSVTYRHGMTGVFLDSPYGGLVEQTRVYATDSAEVSEEVRAWCAENGNNPKLRIALCGYAGEGHDELVSLGWSSHAWKAHGGYGGGRGGVGENNRHRERIYFSPACLKPAGGDDFLDLIGMSEGEAIDLVGWDLI